MVYSLNKITQSNNFLKLSVFLKIVVMFDTFIVINYNKCIEGGVRHEII